MPTCELCINVGRGRWDAPPPHFDRSAADRAVHAHEATCETDLAVASFLCDGCGTRWRLDDAASARGAWTQS